MSRIVLKTYSDFWKVETVLYHLEGWKLPTPMGVKNAGYLLFGFVLTVLITKIPILNLITKLPVLNQPFFYYFGLPFVIMKLLSVIKIEGKHPYQYMFDMLRYIFFVPGHYEYMQPMRSKAGFRIKKVVSCRRVKTKSVFEPKDKSDLIEMIIE